MGPSKQTQQTRCISEQRNRFGSTQDRRDTLVSAKQTGILQTDTQRGALVSTETDLDPLGRHNTCGALASTKEIGTLQADTKEEVHL